MDFDQTKRNAATYLGNSVTCMAWKNNLIPDRCSHFLLHLVVDWCTFALFLAPHLHTSLNTCRMVPKQNNHRQLQIVQRRLVNPFTPQKAKFKTKGKMLNFISKIVKNKQYHLKILLNSVYLNGHTLGFHPHTQKLQPHFLIHGLTLGVKGLRYRSPHPQVHYDEYCYRLIAILKR